ncbi:response regulator transcription factor [Paenibacillus sp. GSMTC-2017]|uniref:response regulator transcription factor n=1 Tax=Paenibacillus sp. GSMTC-2017 TaxID=2794350 RepID=UPI0018D5D616|nr:response regulator transcription factor [Paenibacillus sp. GSMTC-2017]MBH5320836.1 response regulator transcription factor [Paenibacillus sp. GSMTC-2017]
MKYLLITDDDANNRTLLGHYMTKEGYRVLEAQNGREAMNVLAKHAVDLAIFDVMMPEVDGLDLCEYTRKNYDIPIILLTARDGLSDKELGYLKGTDDYVTKPFELPELLFRVRALFRRYSFASSDKIRLNRLVIDRKNYEVVDGDEVFFPPLKEFELLAQLAEYPGRVFSRDELIRIIWGTDYSGDERTVDVHIKRLRQRFPVTDGGFAIHTIRGVGYKLEVSVS